MLLKLLIIIGAFIVFSYALALAFQGTLSVETMLQLPQLLVEWAKGFYHLAFSSLQQKFLK